MENAEALASYTTDLTYDDLDDDTIEAVKLRLLDSIACSFAAMREDSIEVLSSLLRDRPGEEARIIGGGEASIENAAFANCSLVRYVDWNDTITPGGHPADNFGAVISAADATNATGEEFILASVIGYEIQCSLVECGGGTSGGLDSSTNCLASTALSTATLLGLSTEEMTQAVNMAVSGNVSLGQRSRGEISDFKGMASGNASRNGVFSALLAERGITGPAPVWEGEKGLNQLLTEDVVVDLDVFGGDDAPFKVTTTHIKPYPCFTNGQSPVECALTLIEEHDIRAEDIVSIDVETYGHAYEGRSGQWRPKTRGSADHSVPWLIAQAFIHGGIDLEQYQEGNLLTEEVLDMLDKIDVSVEDDLNAMFPEYYPHRMSVETTDGVYETGVDYWHGHMENPLGRDDIEEKFRSQFEVVHGGDPEPLIDWVWSLETHDDVDGLFEHTALP